MDRLSTGSLYAVLAVGTGKMLFTEALTIEDFGRKIRSFFILVISVVRFSPRRMAFEGVLLLLVIGCLVPSCCWRGRTCGTGCFLLMNTGTEPVLSKYGLLTTVAFKLGQNPADYALEGSVAITGALVQWMRDNLGLIQKSSDIETLARTVKDNGGAYFVPAFSGLFAPYWKTDTR